MADQKVGEKIVIKIEDQLNTGQTVLQGSGIKVDDWSQQFQKTRFFRDMNGVLHPIGLNATPEQIATANWGEHYIRDGIIDLTVVGVKAVVSAYNPAGSSATKYLLVNGGKIAVNAGVDGAGQYLKGEEVTYAKNLGANFKLSGFKGTEKFNLGGLTGFERTAAIIANTGYYANMGVRALDNPLTLLDKDAFKLGTTRGKFYIGGAQFKDLTINQLSIGKTSEGFLFKNLLLGKYLPHKPPTDNLAELTEGWTGRDWQSFGNLTNTVNEYGNKIYTPEEAIYAINEYQRIHGKPGAVDDIGETLYQDALKDAAWIGKGAEFQDEYGVGLLNYAAKAWNSEMNFSSPLNAVESLANKTVVPLASGVVGSVNYVLGGVGRVPEFVIKAGGSFVSNIIAPATKLAEINNVFADQVNLENSRVFVRRNANGQYEIIGVQSSFTGPFGEESLDDKIKRNQTYGSKAGIRIQDVDINKLTFSDVGADPQLWLKQLKQRVLDNGLESIYIGRKYPGVFQTPTTPEWTNEQTQNVEEDVIVTTEQTQLAEVVITSKASANKSAGTNKQTQLVKDKKGNTWTFKNGVAVSWKDKNGQIWNYDNASKVSYQTEIVNGKESRIYPSQGERYRDYKYAIERVDLNAYEQNLRKNK